MASRIPGPRGTKRRYTHNLPPPPPSHRAAPAAESMAQEQEAGFTPLEKKTLAKYERIKAGDEQQAEAFALDTMITSANFALKAQKAQEKAQKKKSSPSKWADVYMGTFGQICGVPTILIESIGEGEGCLEFEGKAKRSGKVKSGNGVDVPDGT